MYFNFIYKIKIWIIFFFFINNFNNANAFGQINELGTPFIHNIPPKEYGYENRNFSIVQDKRGIIYIGNLNGVLQYDGTFWRLIKVNGIPYLDVDKNGIVFVGGYNQFGYLAPDKNGKITFISLIHKLNKKHRQFGQILKLIANDNEVLFYTKNKLFRCYNYYPSKAAPPLEDTTCEIELLDTNDTYITAFKVNNEIFVNKYGTGLMIYSEGNINVLPDVKFFHNKDITEILPYNDKLLLKIRNQKGFVLYDSTEIIPFFTQADDFLKKNEFSCGKILSDGNYVLGTKRCGIVIINKNGEILCNINKQNGLYDNDVYNLLIDKSDHLWLAFNNGISRVEFPAAFSFFDESSGIRGGVRSIIRHNGVLYVATTYGVFYLSDNKFFPVKGVLTECFKLFSINNELYVTADNGLYKIISQGYEARLLFKGLYRTVVQSKIDSSVVYVGKSNGLSAYKITNHVWLKLGHLKNLNKYIRTIAEQDDGILWLGTDYEGVFRVDFSNGFDINANVIQLKSNYGLPEDYQWIDVYSTSNGILFSTFKGIYRFNNKSFKFYIDTLIGIDFSAGNIWVYPIVEDIDKNLCLTSKFKDKYENYPAIAYFTKENNQPKAKKYLYVSSPFKRIKDFTIEAIFPDTDDVIWFGSFDGLIRFDTKLQSRYVANEYFTLIRKIVVGKDSVVYYGTDPATFNYLQIGADEFVDHEYSPQELVVGENDGYFGSDVTQIPQFSYRFNSVRFEFSALAYESEDKILYRVFLQGFDKNWSHWDLANIKEYTNLPGGEYMFRVRAKNIYNKLSLEARYKFSISPPVYKTWWAYLIYIVLIGSFIIMVIKWRSYLFTKEKHKLESIIAERTEELAKQKERSEELVSNILPDKIAEELKSGKKASRKKYNMVTVLFSDIQGFTEIAEHMNPEFLLDELDRFFYYFDSVVEKLNIEKIKTIGDAYMCAGGIPKKNRTNPIDVVMAAIEMQQYMKLIKEKSENNWDLRIGIHTGPVIAGVVGSKKYSYDIWGDTVNIASRMESSGKIEEINISDLTYDFVKDYFDCKYRGKIPVKYKGNIGMYFVRGIKPELSVDGKGRAPNEKFRFKLQEIRFDDIDELIMSKLQEGLPKNLYYHNLKHTIDVCNQVELIGRAENISEHDMLMLKTAALFHDTGFLIGYDDHELLGIQVTKEILPKFYYSQEQIDTICDLIYATKLPPEPKNKLEEIICDADLDYLGRTDFIPVSQNLFRELYERSKIKTIEEWNKMQIKFIEHHHYFTDTAKELRNVKKNEQLQIIRKMV